MTKYRLEKDFLGERSVPVDAYFGIQTLRAQENFQITDTNISAYPDLIRAPAMVKQAAASANSQLGILEPELSEAINKACVEVTDGKFHEHFVVDLIQGGAGTSTNMNANEVVANRALEHLGYHRGDYDILHPNTHVNMSQSTNDVYPTAVKLALCFSLAPLIEAVQVIRNSLDKKSIEFSSILKVGRTQLQDAVPMTLGQEFAAFSITLSEEVGRIREVIHLLSEVNLGGTAIGTGLNAPKGYCELVIRKLSDISGLPLKPATNLIEATSDVGAFVHCSSVLKRMAIKISKICNDLRLLSSGPRAGFNEINLPPMQPGSSIMPGKVNPVIPEAINQISYQVIGNDVSITMAAESGQLQLNAMEPLIVSNLLQSIRILYRGLYLLEGKCIRGITANVSRCEELFNNSIGIITALNSYIGYEKASYLAQKALQSVESVVELILQEGGLSEQELQKILNPVSLVSPHE